jgi:VanZ family protein
LPTILWIGLIFFLSSRELSFFGPRIENRESLVRILQYPVHFFLYFVLCLLSFNSFLSGKKGTQWSRALAVALSLTLLVGLCDELLQSVIPSRTFAVRDLFTDAVGALVAMALMTMRSSPAAGLGLDPLSKRTAGNG